MEIDKDRVKHYVRQAVETADGKKRRTIDCNDEVAIMLRDKHTDEDLAAIAKEYGLEDRWNRWSHLSRGQRRMNLGNVLRAEFRRRNSGKESVDANGAKQEYEHSDMPQVAQA